MTSLVLSAVLLIIVCIWPCQSYYQLKELSYLQLPTAISRDVPVFQGLNKNAAVNAAYDFHNNILYVIGRENHLLHVIDISSPGSPNLILTHQFTTADGVPRSISVCDNELAVGLSAHTDVNEGHVRYYHTYARGSGATELQLDGYVTVGAHPDHIQYTQDCGTIVVPNEGEPGKDETGQYRDPEGTIALVHSEKTGNPSVQHVDFQLFNDGEANHRADVRVPSMYIPTSTLSTPTSFAQDVEPEYVAITPDARTAWVTLPANNAIAKISLSSAVVTNVDPLPLKDWTTSPIDASDRDGGVHRRLYPGLKSLRQPTVIKLLEIGNKDYLFTADQGQHRTYTKAAHGFDWSDITTARSVVNSIDDADLKTSAGNDEFLGRLQVSTIDGKNVLQQYQNLVAFGGRGFSIWDSSDFSSPVFDSDGSLEEYMEAYNKAVFNTDYYVSTAAYQSPEIMRDSVSDNLGAQVTALDVKTDNDTTFLVVGTSSAGTLFLYEVDTDSGQPIPAFQSVFRKGSTDMPWNDLYTNKTAGDLYIKDLGIITTDHSPIDKPMVYVISKGAGAVSLYEIEEVPAHLGKK